MTYSHRNGEQEPPTEAGWYWVRGSMAPNDNVGLSALEGVARIMPPSAELDMENFFVTFADTGFFYHVKPSEILCRWWGPVTPPWQDEN